MSVNELSSLVMRIDSDEMSQLNQATRPHTVFPGCRLMRITVPFSFVQVSGVLPKTF